MPRKKHGNSMHSANGTFASAPFNNHELNAFSEDNEDRDPDWALSDNEMSIFSDENEIIRCFPSAETWVERRSRVAAEACETRCQAAVRAAEFALDGPNHCTGGAGNQTGKKRGLYHVGGLAECTLRDKRK